MFLRNYKYFIKSCIDISSYLIKFKVLSDFNRLLKSFLVYCKFDINLKLFKFYLFLFFFSRYILIYIGKVYISNKYFKKEYIKFFLNLCYYYISYYNYFFIFNIIRNKKIVKNFDKKIGLEFKLFLNFSSNWVYLKLIKNFLLVLVNKKFFFLNKTSKLVISDFGNSKSYVNINEIINLNLTQVNKKQVYYLIYYSYLYKLVVNLYKICNLSRKYYINFYSDYFLVLVLKYRNKYKNLFTKEFIILLINVLNFSENIYRYLYYYLGFYLKYYCKINQISKFIYLELKKFIVYFFNFLFKVKFNDVFFSNSSFVFEKLITKQNNLVGELDKLLIISKLFNNFLIPYKFNNFLLLYSYLKYKNIKYYRFLKYNLKYLYLIKEFGFRLNLNLKTKLIKFEQFHLIKYYRLILQNISFLKIHTNLYWFILFFRYFYFRTKNTLGIPNNLILGNWETYLKNRSFFYYVYTNYKLVLSWKYLFLNKLYSYKFSKLILKFTNNSLYNLYCNYLIINERQLIQKSKKKNLNLNSSFYFLNNNLNNLNFNLSKKINKLSKLNYLFITNFYILSIFNSYFIKKGKRRFIDKLLLNLLFNLLIVNFGIDPKLFLIRLLSILSINFKHVNIKSKNTLTLSYLGYNDIVKQFKSSINYLFYLLDTDKKSKIINSSNYEGYFGKSVYNLCKLKISGRSYNLSIKLLFKLFTLINETTLNKFYNLKVNYLKKSYVLALNKKSNITFTSKEEGFSFNNLNFNFSTLLNKNENTLFRLLIINKLDRESLYLNNEEIGNLKYLLIYFNYDITYIDQYFDKYLLYYKLNLVTDLFRFKIFNLVNSIIKKISFIILSNFLNYQLINNYNYSNLFKLYLRYCLSCINKLMDWKIYKLFYKDIIIFISKVCKLYFDNIIILYIVGYMKDKFKKISIINLIKYYKLINNLKNGHTLLKYNLNCILVQLIKLKLNQEI